MTKSFIELNKNILLEHFYLEHFYYFYHYDHRPLFLTNKYINNVTDHCCIYKFLLNQKIQLPILSIFFYLLVSDTNQNPIHFVTSSLIIF